MADHTEQQTDGDKYLRHMDEENLVLEVREDRRLVRLGIDPDDTPLTIYLQLLKRRDLLKQRSEKTRTS